ncbi:retron St85 family RNA-directed DNA polymerase [Hydrogenovibrio halophilus]|uniref:retron St85 family RNA-directed DNA polymerase n=1 Tax=Hydrogenovibrio halophilus TaxID=373391 RepID=UPI00035DE463|nr:retron St85 family RNA-directed DNA polymerase [Hydrogenovibrio halophilus]
MSLIDFLKEKTGVHKSTLKSFVRSAPHRYKTFPIDKRNSDKKRLIAQPSRLLKKIQNLVVSEYEFLINLPIHPCVMSYVKGKSIRDNALVHKDSSYLLKMDFKDFFPSIKPSDLIEHIEKHKRVSLDDDEKDYLSRLFFYSQSRKEEIVLSIGAPSSPYISNTVLYDFDVTIAAECDSTGVKYTRYADDLTFSSNDKQSLINLHNAMESILSSLQYPKLALNTNKTTFLSKRVNRHVTGLVINNDGGVGIGRKKKREIKSLVHRYLNHSLEDERHPYLRGYLAYIWGVDKQFVAQLEAKYEISILDVVKQLEAD